MKLSELPSAAAEYVRAVNEQDATAFAAIFTEDATVNDAGREFRGRAQIAKWAESDIFVPQVTLEVLGAVSRDGETILTTRVEGNFDRTGLPDPVVIDQHIVGESRIKSLTCRLASSG